MSWQLLKPGGMLIFDDYMWGDFVNNPTHTPKLAFDAFASIYRGQFFVAHAPENLFHQYQMIIIKNK